VDEIAAGVYVATADRYTTTTTIVVGADGGCLLIDPAVTVADLAWLAGWLSERGLRPVAGWSTHPHWDHLLWSATFGDVPRYATPRAVATAARELPGLISGVAEAGPGHDLTLFARLEPLLGREIDWAGPRAVVLAHDAHAPGHGAVFLPEVGVLVAGDMCSDIEIPLLDAESPDPFGGYRRGLGLLAGTQGVRVIVPGHGHVGDHAEFRRRVAADFGYLDATEAGADVTDPRLTEEWLRAEHARHIDLARLPPRGRPNPRAKGSRAPDFSTVSIDGLREQGRLALLAQVLVVRTWNRIHLGSFEAAVPDAEEAARLAHETAQPFWESQARAAEATLAALHGDEDRAQTLARAAESESLPAGASAVLAEVQLARGLSALGGERFGEAYEHFRRLLDRADPVYHYVKSTWSMGDLAEAAVHSGHRDDVAETMSELEALSARAPSPQLRVALAYARPLLAAGGAKEALFLAGLGAIPPEWPFARARQDLPQAGDHLTKPAASGAGAQPVRGLIRSGSVI
jgi:hydroxyacylglutathione hydrolase